MISPAAQQSLIKNAHRLYDDAKCLYANGRYATSVALSILAIEEVGKYHAYIWERLDPTLAATRKFPPRHTDKHAAFVAPFVAMVQQEAIVEICRKLTAQHWPAVPGADDWEKSQNFVTELYTRSQDDKNPEGRKEAVGILNAIVTFVENRVIHHPLACLIEVADSGHIEEQKQTALYLDVHMDGTVKSDPAKINQRESEFWFEIAKVAIESLTSDFHRTNAAGVRWTKCSVAVANQVTRRFVPRKVEFRDGDRLIGSGR